MAVAADLRGAQACRSFADGERICSHELGNYSALSLSDSAIELNLPLKPAAWASMIERQWAMLDPSIPNSERRGSNSRRAPSDMIYSARSPTFYTAAVGQNCTGGTANKSDCSSTRHRLPQRHRGSSNRLIRKKRAALAANLQVWLSASADFVSTSDTGQRLQAAATVGN